MKKPLCGSARSCFGTYKVHATTNRMRPGFGGRDRGECDCVRVEQEAGRMGRRSAEGDRRLRSVPGPCLREGGPDEEVSRRRNGDSDGGISACPPCGRDSPRRDLRNRAGRFERGILGNRRSHRPVVGCSPMAEDGMRLRMKNCGVRARGTERFVRTLPAPERAEPGRSWRPEALCGDAMSDIDTTLGEFHIGASIGSIMRRYWECPEESELRGSEDRSGALPAEPELPERPFVYFFRNRSFVLA